MDAYYLILCNADDELCAQNSAVKISCELS